MRLTNRETVVEVPDGPLSEMFPQGLRLGSCIELHGAENVGKSTLCLQLAALVQGAGGRVLYVDADCGLSYGSVHRTGVLDGSFYIGMAYECTEMYNMVIDALPQYHMIVLDSLAAIPTQEELEDITNSLIGKHSSRFSRLTSLFIKKLMNGAYRHQTLCVVVNQMRQNPESGYYVPTGGKTLHSCVQTSIRLRHFSEEYRYPVRWEHVKHKSGPLSRGTLHPDENYTFKI